MVVFFVYSGKIKIKVERNFHPLQSVALSLSQNSCDQGSTVTHLRVGHEPPMQDAWVRKWVWPNMQQVLLLLGGGGDELPPLIHITPSLLEGLASTVGEKGQGKGQAEERFSSPSRRPFANSRQSESNLCMLMYDSPMQRGFLSFPLVSLHYITSTIQCTSVTGECPKCHFQEKDLLIGLLWAKSHRQQVNNISAFHSQNPICLVRS